jgi:DNA excision repair protein ERCC-2
MLQSGSSFNDNIDKGLSFDRRPWQPKIIERALQSIRSKKRVVLDAPTGSGKTLIALSLIRQVLSEGLFKNAYVAVRTINEMFPYERDVRAFLPDTHFKYILGKRRACPFYTIGDDNNGSLCGACLRGDNPRMVVDPSAIGKDIPRGLFFLEKKYVKQISSVDFTQGGVCLYQSMKDIPASFAIITYPYIISEEISHATIFTDSGASIRDTLPDSILIVDEAHNLENSSEPFTDKISARVIQNAQRGMKDFRHKFKTEQDFARFDLHLSYFAVAISGFFNENSDNRGAQHREKEEFRELLLRREVKESIEQIQDVHAKIEEEKRGLARSGSTKKLANPLFPIIDFLTNFESMYVKIELFAENGGLSMKVLDPKENLKILSEAGGLVLMSGTMPSSEKIERVWGIESLDDVRLTRDYGSDYNSVFPQENKMIRVLPLVSTRFTTRSNQMWQCYASMIEQVHTHNEKTTLACCPSYPIAQNIHSFLSEQTKKHAILETTNTRLEEIMRQISEKSQNGAQKSLVMGVARGKILEGVEFVEDGSSLIGAVIVAGVPYPMSDDIQKWRSKMVMKRLGIQSNDKLEFEFFTRDPALVAVRQAIGRAIRFPQDRATIYLADYRFNDKFWKNELGAKK